MADSRRGFLSTDATRWIAVDLRAPCRIEAVCLVFEAAPSDALSSDALPSDAFSSRAVTFVLEVSSDGKAWRSVCRTASGSDGRLDGHLDVRLPEPVTARWIRMASTGHFAARPVSELLVATDVSDQLKSGWSVTLEPLHVQTSPMTWQVLAANRTARKLNGASITAKIYDLSGKQRSHIEQQGMDIAPRSTAPGFTVSWPASVPPAHLLRLELRDSGGVLLSQNTYWRYAAAQDTQWLNTLARTKPSISVHRPWSARTLIHMK